jgi:hypothetical protein
MSCRSFVSELDSGGTELVEVGREQPFKPGRISPALQAQRLVLGCHGLSDLLVRGDVPAGLRAPDAAARRD